MQTLRVVEDLKAGGGAEGGQWWQTLFMAVDVTEQSSLSFASQRRGPQPVKPSHICLSAPLWTGVRSGHLTLPTKHLPLLLNRLNCEDILSS